MNLLFHDKKIYEPVETELFRGWAPSQIQVIEGKPNFIWKGALIPWDLWAQAVSFLRWTQEQFKEEAMLTFFYHPADRTWALWAFPQEPNGMTVKLLPEHPLYKEDRKKFGKGWVQLGSIHHHCTSKAFQSGTDSTDECDRDGIHITIGELDKEYVDIHARQVLNGAMNDCSIVNWLEAPPFLAGCPRNLIGQFTFLAAKAVKDADYPEEWEERIFKKVYTPPVQTSFPMGTHLHPPAVDNPRRTLVTAGDSTNSHKPKGQRLSTTKTPWEEKCKERIFDICKGLSIAPLEMLSILARPSTVPLTMEEKIIEREIKKALDKVSIPLVYAERLLEDMTN